ncbi:hypothetical protein PRK78_000386 [Emydomyces testavorans]|uniref:Uncharacterized protein n=1 Tax=Emydomyces testavorans TaxID=2070801 RepID=A0AAF0IHL2_9EURO|nr:hypothetical protein PRK78_000386 [Emydomyces testavorans]
MPRLRNQESSIQELEGPMQVSMYLPLKIQVYQKKGVPPSDADIALEANPVTKPVVPIAAPVAIPVASLAPPPPAAVGFVSPRAAPLTPPAAHLAARPPRRNRRRRRPRSPPQP